MSAAAAAASVNHNSLIRDLGRNLDTALYVGQNCSRIHSLFFFILRMISNVILDYFQNVLLMEQ